MADIEFALRIEQIGVGALAGERAGRQRRDEMRRRCRQDAAHARAAILQPPDQVERFVGRDAAADDQQDALLCGRGGARWLRRWRRRRIWRIDQIERFAAGSSAACRRMTRTSSSMDRPWRAARSRNSFFSFSSSCRTVEARHRRSSG